MIYFKTRVLKYITFTFVPATFELYQLGVPIRVKKRYILVLHGEVYRFRGPYKDDLRGGVLEHLYSDILRLIYFTRNGAI